MSDAGRIAVIGIGNEYRRDDGAGIRVARSLEDLRPEITVLELPGEGTEIIEAMRDFDRVFLVDASNSGAPPGTILEFDVTTERLPVRFFNYSTHAFGVAEAIEVARALDVLPRSVSVFSIEGEDFDAGPGISHVVADAADRVSRLIRQKIVSGT